MRGHTNQNITLLTKWLSDSKLPCPNFRRLLENKRLIRADSDVPEQETGSYTGPMSLLAIKHSSSLSGIGKSKRERVCVAHWEFRIICIYTWGEHAAPAPPSDKAPEILHAIDWLIIFGEQCRGTEIKTWHYINCASILQPSINIKY
jgi:hypothetical protein